MFKDLAKLISSRLNGQRAKEYAVSIWEKARFSSWEKFIELATWYADQMAQMGLEQVELLELPADGKTSFAGICLPRCWEVTEAVVKLVQPHEEVLMDYHQCPCSLMFYSASTPPEGLTAKLVKIDSQNLDSQTDLRGKIGFTSEPHGHINTDRLYARGLAGIISDRIANQPEYNEKIADAVQWHNFTINPFRHPRLWGAAVSPRQGRNLARLLERSGDVKVHARIITRSYPGKWLLPTGIIPGTSDEEVVITGHICEQGADDNASGGGLGLEIVRCLHGLIRDGLLPRPRRTIRLLPSFEVRGMQGFVHLYPRRADRLVAGLVLDNVGATDCKQVVIHPQFGANPAYTDFLIAEIFAWVTRQSRFGWAWAGCTVNDNLLGDPLINAPTPVLTSTPIRHWHTSQDVPETLSPHTLKWVGAAAATYSYFIGNAGAAEARWLVDLVHARVPDGKKSDGPVMATYLQSVARLVGGEQKSKVSQYVEELKSPAQTLLPGADAEWPAEMRDKEFSERIPRRNYIGFVGFDDLNAEELSEYEKINQQLPGWISPESLNAALFYCDGVRNMAQIVRRVQQEFPKVDTQWLVKMFFFLEKRGLLTISNDPPA